MLRSFVLILNLAFFGTTVLPAKPRITPKGEPTKIAHKAQHNRPALFLGGYGGANMALLNSSGQSPAFSPEVGIRLDYRRWSMFGVLLDLGYAQSRYRVRSGLISVDFLTSFLGGYYHYSTRRSTFYGGIGFSMAYQLSGQFEDSAGVLYNFDNEFNDIKVSTDFKAGYEFALGRIRLFSDITFGYDITSSVKPVQNPVLQQPEGGGYVIRLDLGGKYGLF